ncbi:MAG: hypothetical protein J7L39_00180, partial [Candidatus Aenigmarchaeota archaeon]|nr:hypothetical protein [Candidatus Aenigmarchaeota archaeon]
NITRELFENITEFCFSLETNNETIYSSCSEKGGTLSVSSVIASGYEIGKPVFGYVARAWVTKVIKNTTEVIPFYPEGSGWTGNRLEIRKKFELPLGVQILNATFYLSAHFGTDKSSANFETLKVNGIEKRNDIVWMYMQEESYGFRTTTAAYGYVDVTNDVKPGENEIYLSINTPYYHSHLHPGMRLVVTYTISQNTTETSRKINKRFYFDNVVGRTGAWSVLPFNIPKNAKNVSATLHLNLQNVEDTRIWLWNAVDILVYVNDDVYYRDGTATGCYFYTDSGYYCVRSVGNSRNLTLNFDISSEVQNGTNIVSIYLNSHGDLHWGVGDAIIYSDPQEDPEDSSYIEVSYDLESPEITYGEIDITEELLFGGNAENPKDFIFNISSSPTRRSLETFIHIAQAFSSMLETYVNNELIFESPSPRAVPENVYVDNSYLINGSNFITLRDVQPSGGLSPTNYYLPWSSVEHTYIVKGIVGYGEVFNSSELAINDAINRLKQQVGEEGISATNIQIEKKSVYGLRWLWGPSNFKVVVWER